MSEPNPKKKKVQGSPPDNTPQQPQSENPATAGEHAKQTEGTPPSIVPQQPPPVNAPAPPAGDTTKPSAEATDGQEQVPPSPKSDYPKPRSLASKVEFVWDEDAPHLADNFAALGRALAEAGDLYRVSSYAGGLMLASSNVLVPPVLIVDGRQLARIIVDRLLVKVLKDGKRKSGGISASVLATMLGSEAFLQQFLAIDEVLETPRYLPAFTLTKPGYNDGGPGQRFLYIGPEARSSRSLETIMAFLSVMSFATNADRTNAIAAALTVMLRNFFPGAKPALVFTSTKSHGGKETCIQFAAGSTPHVSVSYQEGADWALERSIVGALKHDGRIGVINVENARLGRKARVIGSSFLERFITDAEPFLFSTGTGSPVRRRNQWVIALSTNFGTISEDLLNRALPIHLAPVGDVAERQSPIGNPKLEYLPANRAQIEAELHGMIETWKEAGMPLDKGVRHPFTQWAEIIGGILKTNGCLDFLGNYSMRRTTDDQTRQALGILGGACLDQWRRPQDWADRAMRLGLVKAVIPEGDQASTEGRTRGIGVVLTAHRDERFTVETEGQRLELRLQKHRGRFDNDVEPSTRYRFATLKAEPIPADGDEPQPSNVPPPKTEPPAAPPPKDK